MVDDRAVRFSQSKVSNTGTQAKNIFNTIFLPPKTQSGIPAALKKPPALKVPATAKAPDFSRGVLSKETKVVKAPKPTPTSQPKQKEQKQPKPKAQKEVAATPPSFGGVSGASSSEEAAEAAVKSAPIDTVVFIDEAFSSEFIADLLFEDIAGQELLSIARNDTVNGQSVVYQPIKNLGILRDAYNPNNLLRLQETSDRFFANFIINLSEKIPNVGSGANGANYYLDLTTGDGVIELINIKSDEQVEVQIANAGTIEDVGI
jgi:hypothetical protein